MNKEARDILIGIAALCSVVFAVVILVGADHRDSGAGNGYLVKAVFNRIDGLFPGDEVSLSGIKVGSVIATSLDDRFRATVTMRIDNSLKLSDDTSIAIHTNGLFGSKFMVLEPGGSDDLLADGDTIGYTQDAMVVTDLLDLIIAEGQSARARRAAEEQSE